MFLVILSIILSGLIALFIFRRRRRVVDVSKATVLITGAASGVGRQLAKQLASRGAKLILWDLQLDKLTRLKQKLPNSSAHSCFKVDVSKSAAISATLNDICKSTKIDIIIANAGIVTGKMAKNLTDDEIDATLAVNTKQHMFFAREIFDKLSPTGTFAIVASVAGMFPLTQLSDYGASKVASLAFMESLRSELRREGRKIRTCTICPFLIDTKMFNGIKVKFPASLLSQPLKREYVAQRLIEGIEYGESLILVPALMNILPLVWLLPEWIRDLLRDAMDEPSYMDTFRPPETRLQVLQEITNSTKKVS